MSKKCVITQIYNEEKQQYEYFVKGYDITESIKILLKKHKEAYDKERRIFAEAKGYIEAQKEYETQFYNQQNEIQKLKQQLAEKDKEIAHLKEKDNYHLRYELAGADETITNLKQQLKEKDKLLKCYQEEEKLIADMLGDKDLTIIGSRVHLKNLIVELKNKIKDKDIVIEEKDKEIERLKVFEKAYYFNQTQVSQESIDLLLQNAYQVHNETQLAIQELKKVKDTLKHFCDIHSDEYYMIKTQVKGIEQDVCESIDYQIRELKGE